MIEKSMRQRLKDGEVLCGPWCVVPSPAVANIVAASGFDFLVVDMEHGITSFETAENMVRAAHSEGVHALIRQPNFNEDLVLKSLETGSDGLICAHVESAEDAAKAVSYSRYYPQGVRGFSPFTRAGRYSGGDDIRRHAAIQNERVTVGIILEGKNGLDNLDAILQVEGIDLIYIGAYDLSQALGMPGDVNHPKIKETMESCVKKIRQADIAVGGFVARTADDIRWMTDIGMQFISYLVDCAVMHLAFKEAADTFKSIVGR